MQLCKRLTVLALTTRAEHLTKHGIGQDQHDLREGHKNQQTKDHRHPKREYTLKDLANRNLGCDGFYDKDIQAHRW